MTNDNEIPVGERMLAELRAIRALLGEMSGVQPIRWYCVPEVDAQGEYVCEGGQPLFRHQEEYESNPDRLYHKLDEAAWREVDGPAGAVTKRNHNLWKSQAKMTPEEGRAAEPLAVLDEIVVRETRRQR